MHVFTFINRFNLYGFETVLVIFFFFTFVKRIKSEVSRKEGERKREKEERRRKVERRSM